MAIDISVIICTYNREKYLTWAMESLLQQSFDKSRFEVIVVNNNSIDKTEQVCNYFIAAHPDYKFYYFNESRQGSSFARNKGAIHAKGTLLIFMDDDAIAEKEYLQNSWTFFSKHPDIQGFGGRIIPHYIPEEPRWMSHFVSSLVGNFDYSPVQTEFSPNKYPLESNMAITKKVFDQIGGFSEALPGVKGTLRIGGEGKDLYFRMKKEGHKIFYVPQMVVHHVVETVKLTPEYLGRIASGIGRGERQRIKEKGVTGFLLKISEYLFKLGASVLIGLFYFITFRPAKMWPVIRFRIDALRGLLGN